MKHYLISLIAFTGLLLSTNTHAQDVRLGAGISYGTVIKTIGFNARVDVKLDRQWSIVPHANWFLNRTNGPITNKWREFNIDGHYNFEIDQTWFLYPLFGINFATVQEKVNDITFSNSEIGANLGFGSEFIFTRQLSGFGEVKYVISDADQAVFTLGLLFLLTQ